MQDISATALGLSSVISGCAQYQGVITEGQSDQTRARYLPRINDQQLMITNAPTFFTAGFDGGKIQIHATGAHLTTRVNLHDKPM
jgi:hypothetical protein